MELESDTDVKELVPEFYATQDGWAEFLHNGDALELGTLQRAEGQPATDDQLAVNDCALPPWAGGDPRRFVSTCRAALDSAIVREGLPGWIDLVFGFAQEGVRAVRRACTL